MKGLTCPRDTLGFSAQMYGKVFESMWTGSMMGVGANKQSVWVYALAHTRKGSVELNPSLIAKQIGMSVKQATQAIEYLCAPDPESRSKEEDGKRLLKVGQYLYEVVNWEHYRSLHSEDERREYERNRKRNYRARKSQNVRDMSGTKGDSPGMSRMSRNAEADAEADANGERARFLSQLVRDIPVPPFQPPSKDQVKEFALSKKFTASYGLFCWKTWTGNNWRHYSQPIVSQEQWQCLLETDMQKQYKP